MEGVQELHFSWNEHKDFLTKALKQQRDSEQYCDISLVSNDGFVVRAHQAVLAAASGWFLRVLSRHSHSHPTVVLDTVSLVLLKAVINYIYFGTIQIEKSLLSDLLEVADCLDLKGLCRIRKNSGINKFLPSNSTKNEQENSASQSARSSPVSRENAVRSSVATSVNSSNSESCTVNSSCSSAFLFEETPSGASDDSFPAKLTSTQSDGQSRCSTSLQASFPSQSKSGDSLSGLATQPFLPCTSGVHSSVSASVIDSPSLHCNSSFTPSSATYFNQTSLPLYNNRPPLMVMHQQAQHQQFSSQHQPQPSLQLYNPGASLNPCHSKQGFDSRMVGSAIDYQHPPQQHSLDDFRPQSLSNKSGIKSSPGLPQKLCYHQQPGIDSLPLQQNLTNPHQNSQLCLQLQQPEQLELQPDRHNYPYGQSAAHIPYSSPLLSGACNPHDNSQSNQLLSLQHQQQPQTSYIYGSECSAPLDLPGLGAKPPGMHFLRGSNSGCSTMGYQTTGIDLSLTKSEPSSPRDYTASGPAVTVAVDSLACGPDKRKRGDEVSNNNDSDEEDGDDEEEEEGCVELVDGESCEDAVEGQCALNKKFRAASGPDQTAPSVGRASGGTGTGDDGSASGLPPAQPEGLPALDVAALAREWDCPSPERSPSTPEAACAPSGEREHMSTSSACRLSQPAKSPSKIRGNADRIVIAESNDHGSSLDETKAAKFHQKTPPAWRRKKERGSVVQAPTTWRVLSPIDGPGCNVTERIFNGKKIVEVGEIDIASSDSEAGYQGSVLDGRLRRSALIKDMDGTAQSYEVQHPRRQSRSTASPEICSHGSNISTVAKSTNSFTSRGQCHSFFCEVGPRRRSAPIAEAYVSRPSNCSPTGSSKSTFSDLVYINKIKASRRSADCTSQLLPMAPDIQTETGVRIEKNTDSSLFSDDQVTSEGSTDESRGQIDVMSNVSRNFLTLSKVNAGASCSTDVSRTEEASRAAARITDYYLKEANKKVVMPKMTIKRPPNQFMLFSRSVRSAVAAQHPHESSAAISARIAEIWKKLPENERLEWTQRARDAREEHQRLYPGYNFPAQAWKHQRLLYKLEKEKKRSLFTVSPRQ